MANRGDRALEETMAPDVRRSDLAGLGTGGAPTLLPYGLTLSSGMEVMRAEQTLQFLGIDHVALRVADVRRAEAFYYEFFQMDVVLRARQTDRGWEPMPGDFDWIEGLRTGYYPSMIYLRNGALALMLINAGRGAIIVEPRLEHIAVRVTPETLTALRGIALVRSFAVTEDSAQTFRFRDPYGVLWHLTAEGA